MYGSEKIRKMSFYKSITRSNTTLRKYTEKNLTRQKRRQISKGKKKWNRKTITMRSNTQKITHVTRQWNSDSHAIARDKRKLYANKLVS